MNLDRGGVYFVLPGYTDQTDTSVGSEIQVKEGRPAVILSPYGGIGDRTNVSVVYLSSLKGEVEKLKLSSHVGPTFVGNRQGFVKCENVYTVSIERIGKKIGFLPPEVMQQVDEAIANNLGLSCRTLEIKEMRSTIETLRNTVNFLLAQNAQKNSIADDGDTV